ncbi:tripartite tricarboxylate transporter substrate-binding protein [Cupriavidus basilensis]
MAFTDVLTALPLYQERQDARAGRDHQGPPLQALPDVPTVAEQGVPGFDVSVFFGVVAPAGTPPAVITRLNHALLPKRCNSPKCARPSLAQGLNSRRRRRRSSSAALSRRR